MGSGGVGKFPRIFSEFFENFPGIFRDNRKLQRDIVQPQNKISTHGLYQNDSTIMTDSPVEYLRKPFLMQLRKNFLPPSISVNRELHTIELLQIVKFFYNIH